MLVRMNQPSNINQDELERLMAAANTAPPLDHRYTMRLDLRQGCAFLVITGTVLQGIPDEYVARFSAIFDGTGMRRAVLDLTACDYLCSGAVGFLVEWFRRANATGSQVLMLRPKDRIRRVVEILGLTDFFLMVEDEGMAIEYYREQERLSGEYTLPAAHPGARHG